jgi:hypothetical protein
MHLEVKVKQCTPAVPRILSMSIVFAIFAKRHNRMGRLGIRIVDRLPKKAKLHQHVIHNCWWHGHSDYDVRRSTYHTIPFQGCPILFSVWNYDTIKFYELRKDPVDSVQHLLVLVIYFLTHMQTAILLFMGSFLEAILSFMWKFICILISDMTHQAPYKKFIHDVN